MARDGVAPLSTGEMASNMLDLTAKFVRVLTNAGVSWDALMRPVNDRAARRNLVAFLNDGCPKYVSPTSERSLTVSGYEMAHAILGKDFIAPEEIVAANIGVVYTDEQLDQFMASLPSQEAIEWARDNRFILVPGPNMSLSLLQIYSLGNQHFYQRNGPWFGEKDQMFSRDESVTSVWYVIRKGEVPRSLSKTWDEQKKLIRKEEYIPTGVEIIWAMFVHKMTRGTHLFKGTWVRTSSVTANGDRVYAGVRDGQLDVGSHWDDNRHSYLGVSAARKF